MSFLFPATARPSRKNQVVVFDAVLNHDLIYSGSKAYHVLCLQNENTFKVVEDSDELPVVASMSFSFKWQGVVAKDMSCFSWTGLDTIANEVARCFIMGSAEEIIEILLIADGSLN